MKSSISRFECPIVQILNLTLFILSKPYLFGRRFPPVVERKGGNVMQVFPWTDLAKSLSGYPRSADYQSAAGDGQLQTGGLIIHAPGFFG